MTYHDDKGCHCAEGAIALVTGHHVQAPADIEDWWENNPDAEVLNLGPWFALPDQTALRRRLRAERAVEKYLDLDFDRALHHWNDAPSRTAAEVIAALRAAADAADAAEAQS
jgi:hypothetical protein